MKELKNNVNTLLWLMVTLSVMVVFLTLSSCNSSVKGGEVPSPTPNPGPGPGPTITVKITVIAPKEGGSIKVNGEVLKETKEFTPKVGDTMAFEAVTNDGYKFKEWIPKKLGNKETFELTVDKDLSVSIKFEKGNNPPGPGPSDTDFPFKITKDSPIVYKTSGLGFGKKKGDLDGIYYAISDYEEGKDNGLVGDDLTGDGHPTGNKAPFTSIHEGLKTRWDYYKGKNPNKFEDEGKSFTQLFNDPSYKICLKDNNVDEMRIHPNGVFYANWSIVFVNKNENKKNEGYHFTFGPYRLHKDQTEQEKEILKNNCLNPGRNPLKYKFTLDDLFKISLKNKYKINPTDKEMSEFNEFKSKIGSDYDVYLVVIDSGLFEHSDGSNFPESTDKDFCWCNVLKFNDPFWNTPEN